MNKQPSNGATEWMRTAGVIAVVVGILGFIASAAAGGGGTLEGAIIAGLLNPLFFVGVPLGIYWLRRGRALSQSSQTLGQPPIPKPAPLAPIQSKPARVAETPLHLADGADAEARCEAEELARKSDREIDAKRIGRESSAVSSAMGMVGVAFAGIVLAGMTLIGITGDPGVVGRAPTRDLSQPSHSEVRRWKDNTSNFETEAFLVGVSKDRVRLQKTNGKQIWVPIRRLSNEDQEWVQQAVAQDSRLVLHDQRSTDEPEPRNSTDVAEDAMFTLATQEAVARVMRHVDRPFDAEFGRPLIQINPEDPTIAYVCVRCTHQESGVGVSKLFLVVFENGRSPQRAEISDDLICLLVNSDGTVLERDDEYWSELPIESQRIAGALNTNGPPWIAKTILNLSKAIPADSR